ncbi:BfmA/BtgA family mobilization protein [Gillisia sp. CAL575]|uniref:BfmA/BtgA family mobilization protein n=1 Tax=Gillisia sp. CAL575 TaxID=985255 RepID=UPI0003A1CEBE|nr:BfmA/BtgA family mobilization protein [Gillisia sp. CAL575]
MSRNFSRINFHTETVERFKKHAIENEVNYTETLEAMLDFFDHNFISPFEPFPLTNYRLLNIFNNEWMRLKYCCAKWNEKV